MNYGLLVKHECRALFDNHELNENHDDISGKKKSRLRGAGFYHARTCVTERKKNHYVNGHAGLLGVKSAFYGEKP